jgi:hypothetical protein
MGIIRSNYIIFYEIICNYEAKDVEKLDFFFKITVSNASYLCFEKKMCPKIFVLMC